MNAKLHSASPEQVFAHAASGRGFSAAAPDVSNVIKLPKLRANDLHLGDTAVGVPVVIDLPKLLIGRLLIQGNSGAGKSSLLRRLFEQAFGRVQQLVVDVDGEFSTLRDGFDIAIVTAAEADRVGGRTFALHLREHRYSAVLDLSDANSEDRLRLVADIAAGLIDAPEAHWHPLLVLIDEAQTLAPHYDTGDVELETRKRAIASLAELMSRGRKRGIAGVIATQRLAETSKAVCAKATNVIIGRTFLDLDLDRAGALLGFTRGQSRPIRNLADGEFLCLGPALAGPTRMRFRAGPTTTRHKGDAPAVIAPPKVSAAKAAELLRQVPAGAGESSPAAASHARRPGRRGREWLQAEDQIIRDGYAAGLPIVAIGAQLATTGFSTSISNISMRAHSLGLVSAKAAVAWSDAEDEILRDAYAREVKLIDIVELLNKAGHHRGRVSVQMRAIALGITRDRVNYWVEPEKKIAIEGLTAGKPHREILADLRAAGFDRGITGLTKFAQKNNFSRPVDPWTLEQVEELKRLYADKVPPKEIAERLGKPIAAIRTRASNLGLKQRVAWSQAEYDKLVAMHARGESLMQVAQSIGRPYPNVARVASQLQLDFRQHSGPPRVAKVAKAKKTKKRRHK